MTAQAAAARTPVRVPAWVLLTGALLVVAAALAALAAAAGRSLPARTGPPVEQLAVERTVLRPGSITLTVRNTGPDPVRVAQVFVNDSYVNVTGGSGQVGRLRSQTLRLDYPWLEGQPYLVSLLTSSGAVLEHPIPVAAATPRAGPGFFALMALLGTYVGVLPVLLGMLFLPLLRRVGAEAVRVLLAATVGLLAFLALDGATEAVELATAAGGAFGGTTLVVLGAALAFLALTGVQQWLRARAATTEHPDTGRRLATSIALGIGLHNLGEGLAIGSAYAVGELALGAALVVGFALHNTTEGVAVVAPLRGRTAPGRLLALGLLAGGPAIVGALLGAAVDNRELSALLLGVGVGAIAQVIVQILPAVRRAAGAALDPLALGGVGAGVLVMYATGLLVPA